MFLVMHCTYWVFSRFKDSKFAANHLFSWLNADDLLLKSVWLRWLTVRLVSSSNNTGLWCSQLFWYSRSLGLLAPVTHGMITYIQEPLEIGRRGSMGRHFNWNTLAAVNGHLRPLRKSVAYKRDVGVGVPATVLSW
jgi:hypothetical protein